MTPRGGGIERAARGEKKHKTTRSPLGICRGCGSSPGRADSVSGCAVKGALRRSNWTCPLDMVEP